MTPLQNRRKLKTLYGALLAELPENEPNRENQAQLTFLYLLSVCFEPGLLQKIRDWLKTQGQSRVSKLVPLWTDTHTLPLEAFDAFVTPWPASLLCRILDTLQKIPASKDEAARVALTPLTLSDILESCQSRHQKQSSGSFYTPEALVDYMCQETLHLLPEEPCPEPHWICDPACGAGAFLVGALKNWTAQGLPPPWVVGVDANPVAVFLARLRLWFIYQKMGVQDWAVTWIKEGNALAPTAKNAEQLWISDAFRGIWPKDGLDVVLGNPPYLGERGHQALFQSVCQGPLKAHYQGKMDLLYFFFHLGIELLKPQGHLTFLTSHYFATATYASHLRQFLKSQTWIKKLYNFQNASLFARAVGHHSMMSFLQKTSAPGETQLLVCQKQGRLSSEDSVHVLSEAKDYAAHLVLPPKSLFYGTSNFLMIQAIPDVHRQILQKLEALPGRLKDWAQVHQGIVTGADTYRGEASSTQDRAIFVYSQDLLQTYPFGEDAYFKPWFKNSDISRWNGASSSKYRVLYASREVHHLSPELLDYLSTFRPLLERRREVRKGVIQWWQLQWPRHSALFEEPQIVAPQRSRLNCFALTSPPWYASADVYFMKTPVPQLFLWWLNSPLVFLWLWYYGKRKGALLELYQEPLKRIPLPFHNRAQLQALAAQTPVSTAQEPRLSDYHFLYPSLGLMPTEVQELELFFSEHLQYSGQKM